MSITIEQYGQKKKNERITSTAKCIVLCTVTRNLKKQVRIIYFFILTCSLFLIWQLFTFKKYSFIYFYFFFLELESWSITEMLYDEESRHLSRPNNPNPLSDTDRAKRRKLLRQLGNQLATYLMDIKTENLKIQNNFARANPIVLN